MEESRKFNVEKLMQCQHQYFEIKKLAEYGYTATGSAFAKRQGVLVKCALCEESKELWEDK